MRTDLKAIIMEYDCPSLDAIHEEIIPDCQLSLLQIRDRLYCLGTILLEDTERQVYVAKVRSGFSNMNYAVVAMQLRGRTLMVVGYAKEGFIKQNIWGNALGKLKAVAQRQETPSPTKHKKIIVGILACGVLLITLLGIVFVSNVCQTIAATKEYNRAVTLFNQGVAKYNETIVLTSVDNISGLPAVMEPLNTESEMFWDNLMVMLGQNSKEKIISDAETVYEMAKQVQSATQVLAQITAPSGEWVAERLQTLPGVTGVEAVTEERDPDDLLGKEGGFAACIYFTIDKINPDEVPGASIVEKGTDAGGAVEIYASLADAKARCDYLSGFDGTVLYSGSYAIVGTVVIRTSYKLTNEEQFELTNEITSALTALH